MQPSAEPTPQAFLPLPHLPFHVLLALAERPRHGWSVVRAIRELTGGDNPSSGSLYLAISRLEESGLIEEAPPEVVVEEEPATGAERRKVYQLTPLGRDVLDAETRRLANLVRLARGYSSASGGDRR
jgi:DNA-binding PadR family transcriptional regulator